MWDLSPEGKSRGPLCGDGKQYFFFFVLKHKSKEVKNFNKNQLIVSTLILSQFDLLYVLRERFTIFNYFF